MAHDPSKPIKRLKYFTGQFLEAADFTAEQDYHLGMRLRGNRALYYSAGILDDGFNVTPAENDTKIEISTGIGVNTHGQEMVIVTPIRVSLPVVGEERAYFVTLKYKDTPTDEQTPDQDISDTTRIEEIPIVEFIAEGIAIDKDSMVIARVSVEAGGRVDNIDRNARQYANARFVGRLGVGTEPDPKYALDVRGKTIKLGLEENGGGQLIIGNGAQGDNKIYLEAFNSAGTGNANELLITGYLDREVPKLTLKAVNTSISGNVGIGTPSPLYKLHVLAPGGFGSENADGTSLAGNVPLVVQSAQSDSTVFGVLNSGGRQAFALNIESSGGTSNTRGIPVFYDKYDGQWHSSIYLKNGNVGIGTTDPKAKLQVVGGAIMPAVGNSENSGIMFPKNPGLGGGDEAWIRYYARSGERTALEIGVANDALNDPSNQDDILLMPSGGVGIGTTDPQAKLHVNGDTLLNGNVKFSNARPASNAPFSNVLTPANIVKAWGIISFHPSFSISLINGFNVSAVGFNATGFDLLVTLASTNIGFRCIVVTGNLGGYTYTVPDFAEQTFRIQAYDHTGTYQRLSIQGGYVSFVVLAIQ